MSEEILLTPDAAAEAFEGILEGPQPEGAEEEPPTARCHLTAGALPGFKT